MLVNLAGAGVLAPNPTLLTVPSTGEVNVVLPEPVDAIFTFCAGEIVTALDADKLLNAPLAGIPAPTVKLLILPATPELMITAPVPVGDNGIC
jgi:hypothetical protein